MCFCVCSLTPYPGSWGKGFYSPTSEVLTINMKYRGEEKLLAPILAATSYLVSIYTNYVGPYPAKSGLPEWTIGLSAVFWEYYLEQTVVFSWWLMGVPCNLLPRSEPTFAKPKAVTKRLIWMSLEWKSQTCPYHPIPSLHVKQIENAWQSTLGNLGRSESMGELRWQPAGTACVSLFKDIHGNSTCACWLETGYMVFPKKACCL